MDIALLIEWSIKIGVVFFILMTALAYIVLLERRLLGFIQMRLGPNRVGPFGLLQPLA
ncbi:MAG: NADH-quinone oxidoreductase subunit H, partial [Blastocatellia bacterium]